VREHLVPVLPAGIFESLAAETSMTSHLPSISMRSLILTVARDFQVGAGVMTPDTEQPLPMEGAPESAGRDVL